MAASILKLAEVKADLSRVPESQFLQVRGKDREIYYQVDFHIEVTFYSAYTKYELRHCGINYGQITAEYV